MAGFRRGSTPTNTFNCNVDLSSATVFVTYAQNNKVIGEKTGAVLTVTATTTGSTVELELSQTDTLAFQKGLVEVQIRYVMSDGTADASNIIRVDAERILKDGVISYAV